MKKTLLSAVITAASLAVTAAPNEMTVLAKRQRRFCAFSKVSWREMSKVSPAPPWPSSRPSPSPLPAAAWPLS